MGERRGSALEGSEWWEAERTVRPGGIIKVACVWLQHPDLVDKVGELVVFQGDVIIPRYAVLGHYHDEGCRVLRTGGTRRRYSVVVFGHPAHGWRKVIPDEVRHHSELARRRLQREREARMREMG